LIDTDNHREYPPWHEHVTCNKKHGELVTHHRVILQEMKYGKIAEEKTVQRGWQKHNPAILKKNGS